MTPREVKNAQAQGKTICWSNDGYELKGDSIVCLKNGNSVKWNHLYNLKDLYIKESST